MRDPSESEAAAGLWQALTPLADAAAMLRSLSQQEPLLQARPDYPRGPTPHRSYAGELRTTLEAIRDGIAAVRRLLPAALPGPAPGLLPDETADALERRLAALARLTDTLLVEAFEPPPALPKHAPPYVPESPRRDLAGAKAIHLSYGLEEATASIRNGLLSRANAGARTGAPPA